MCSQLGIVLRRLGVSVVPAKTVLEIQDILMKDEEIRVMTCGKSAKNVSKMRNVSFVGFKTR